jgi:hypothetical protein
VCWGGGVLEEANVCIQQDLCIYIMMSNNISELKLQCFLLSVFKRKFITQEKKNNKKDII